MKTEQLTQMLEKIIEAKVDARVAKLVDILVDAKIKSWISATGGNPQAALPTNNNTNIQKINESVVPRRTVSQSDINDVKRAIRQTPPAHVPKILSSNPILNELLQQTADEVIQSTNNHGVDMGFTDDASPVQERVVASNPIENMFQRDFKQILKESKKFGPSSGGRVELDMSAPSTYDAE